MTKQDANKESSRGERPLSGMEDFKRFFLRGLAALLPALLTIAVVVWAYQVLDEYVGQHITSGLIRVCVRVVGPPTFADEEDLLEDSLTYGEPLDEWGTRFDFSGRENPHWRITAGRRLTSEYKIITCKALQSAEEEVLKRAEAARNFAMWRIVFAKYRLNVIGFVLAAVFVYSMGIFLASLIGRSMWRMAERALYRVPVIRAIYPNFKQVTDFVFSDRKLEFSGVVALEYPRKGLWSLGLVTGPPMVTVARAAGKDLVTVFVPSSPTPVTGYVVTVPREDTIELELTIDEALRFTISGGVIKPPYERIAGTEALPLIAKE